VASGYNEGRDQRDKRLFEHHRGEWSEAVVILKRRLGMERRSNAGSPLISYLLMVTKAGVVVTSTGRPEVCAVVQILARNEPVVPDSMWREVSPHQVNTSH
jgi:hypothetical protein